MAVTSSPMTPASQQEGSGSGCMSIKTKSVCGRRRPKHMCEPGARWQLPIMQLRKRRGCRSATLAKDGNFLADDWARILQRWPAPQVKSRKGETPGWSLELATPPSFPR
jgi:hypothetical protein